jgi:hypothetical protein
MALRCSQSRGLLQAWHQLPPTHLLHTCTPAAASSYASHQNKRQSPASHLQLFLYNVHCDLLCSDVQSAPLRPLQASLQQHCRHVLTPHSCFFFGCLCRPTMSMIALNCPDIEVVVLDINEERIKVGAACSQTCQDCAGHATQLCTAISIAVHVQQSAREGPRIYMLLHRSLLSAS